MICSYCGEFTMCDNWICDDCRVDKEEEINEFEDDNVCDECSECRETNGDHDDNCPNNNSPRSELIRNGYD